MARAQFIVPILLAVVCFWVSNAQMCDRLTVNDIGSSTMITADVGLLPGVLAPSGEINPPPIPVQVLNHTIVCEAPASQKDTYAFVSVVVEFVCSSTSVSDCDSTMRITRQYQFECGTGNTWEATVLNNPTFVQTIMPTANLNTPLSDRCSLCVSNIQNTNSDPVTHCIACPASCNEGQMLCFRPVVGTSSADCCNYYTSNSCVATCQAPLVADQNTFDCGCGPLSLSNGTLDYTNNYAVGSVARHTCNNGYRVEGDPTRTCTLSGWSGQSVTCEFVQCPDLTILNGEVNISPDNRTPNSEATYVCDNGYVLEGIGARYCQLDGTWNGTDPNCEFVQCPELATENGEVTISPENRPLNSKATYTCDKGYKVTGPRERYCQLDGTWNGTDPNCEFVQCPELATENGEVTISPENRPLNSKATYTCDKGYKVSGPRERYCQLDGTWNGTDTKCDKEEDGLSGGAIAGIVIAAVVVVAGIVVAIALIITYLVKKNKK